MPPSAPLEKYPLGAVAASGLRDGEWRLCECTGWPDNASFQALVAWGWAGPDGRELVVVNLSDDPSDGLVHLPWDDLAGRGWTLADRLDGRRFERDGDALAGDGLYVALGPWGSHFLAFAG